MGKLTTATCIKGAMLALGQLSLMPTLAKADYQAYSPQNTPYQIQHASYQTNNNRIFDVWAPQLPIPPDIQPYNDNNNTGFYNPNNEQNNSRYSNPQPRPRYQAEAPSTPRKSASTSKSLNPAREALMQAAYRSLGITYRWGGNTPKEGFDCSGLTKFTHKNVNVSIPRTALEQSKASRTISRQQLKPGDMIFFRTSGKTVNHVGIYVGNGKFIHAASGGGKVTLDDLRRAYWQQRLVKYGTFLA